MYDNFDMPQRTLVGLESEVSTELTQRRGTQQ